MTSVVVTSITGEDYQEETAHERLRVYQENTQPLIEFYQGREELLEIDGEQSIEAVWEAVKDAVRSTSS